MTNKTKMSDFAGVTVSTIKKRVESLELIRNELYYLSLQSSSKVMKEACEYLDSVMDGLKALEKERVTIKGLKDE